MSTLDSTAQLTLLEQANRIDPQGNTAVIAEVLAATNEIMMDIPWTMANDTWTHKAVKRLTLPSGSWRRLNDGVSNEASQTVPVTFGIGMLESYAENDKALIDSFPDKAAARMAESRAFIEGMGQTLASTLFYGSIAATPEKFDGLTAYMGATNGWQVQDVGGTGSDTTSIYVVQWGEDAVHMVYPRGHKFLGVNHEDLGVVTLSGSTGQYQGYRDHFSVYAGLVVRDERCIARVASIETSGTTATFDEDYLIRAINNMRNRGAGCKIYMNTTIWTQMQIVAKDKTNVNYDARDPFGRPLLTFMGHPVRLCDAILNTETAI